MKYLNIRGGLGNQMFQYALYLQLKKLGKNVTFDLTTYQETDIHNGFELQKVFTLDGHNPRIIHSKFINYIRRLSARGATPGKRHGFVFFEGAMRYGVYLEVFTTKAPIIEGYFQSECYFKDAKDEVRKAFVFRDIDDNNINIAEEMKQRNSVAVHIRRGDYAAFGMKLLGSDYYQKAINHIKKVVKDSHFYIFSDDVEEARKIADGCGITYSLITHNTGANSYKDMYLMSNCKHNIIANSSFSWWGAWLNPNPEKVVVSPLWGKYFHCDNWTLIEE